MMDVPAGENHSEIRPATMPPPVANYAHAVLTTAATRWLHTSGVVAVALDGSVPGGIVEQATLVWAHLAVLLAEAQMVPGDVVSVTTYVTPGHDLVPVMALRDAALDGCLAASTLVVVAELARPEWLIEISIVAAR